jgi:hypothetical protein
MKKHITVKRLSSTKQKRHIHEVWKQWIISIYENPQGKFEVTAYPYALAKPNGTKDHYTYLMEHLTKKSITELKDKKLYITGPKATYVKLSKKQYYSALELDIIVDAFKFRLPDVIDFK